MAKKYIFLISYIRDNQPQSATLDSDSESLTPEQALRHLQALHGEAGAISDVQVSRIDPQRTAFSPGHYRQP